LAFTASIIYYGAVPHHQNMFTVALNLCLLLMPGLNGAVSWEAMTRIAIWKKE